MFLFATNNMFKLLIINKLLNILDMKSQFCPQWLEASHTNWKPKLINWKIPHMNENFEFNWTRPTVYKQTILLILCVLDRASSWYLNKGWPIRWHLLYYLLLNMFQTLIRPSSGASEYLLRCVGWLEACWCYVVGLSVGDVVSECRLNHYSDTTSPTANPAT